MKLAALLDRFAAARPHGPPVDESRIQEVLTALPADAPSDWRQLAAVLAVSEYTRPRREDSVPVFGISGGQGAGKSTLAALLVSAAELSGRRAISLSLDDFYLTRNERESLGERVHPLLRTRGVPGTHDVSLAIDVLDCLTSGEPCQVPVFDKSVDDRQQGGHRISEPVDLVILEGWCVGAPAEPGFRLRAPINELERSEDPDGAWRGTVNAALTDTYPALWGRLDTLLYLKVPDLAAVIRWRTEQEQAHPATRRMTAAEIERFVAHYERLTRWMGETLPETADLVGFLDRSHRLEDLAVR